MAGKKNLINRTGKDLKVTLVVRKGDHPDETDGTVNVELSGGSEKIKLVEYGDEVNIYLNGLEIELNSDGKKVNQKRIISERGKGLDDDLNTNDTIVFLYDEEMSSIHIATYNSNKDIFEFKPNDE
jgi:hypothetical protein